MNIKDIIRAWRDNNYRESLTEEQRAFLLENPLGKALSEEELDSIGGGLQAWRTSEGPGCSRDCLWSVGTYAC